jgi:hypothetical protein
MLRAENVSFVKALLTIKVSPALLKELRSTIAERIRVQRPSAPVGKRGPEGPVFSHRTPHRLAGKRKATEFAGSVVSPEPAA